MTHSAASVAEVRREMHRKRLAFMTPGVQRGAMQAPRPGLHVVPFSRPERGGIPCSNMVEIKARLRPWWDASTSGSRGAVGDDAHARDDATPGAMSIFAYVPRTPASSGVGGSRLSVFDVDPRHCEGGALAGGAMMVVEPRGLTLGDIGRMGCCLRAPAGDGEAFHVPPGRIPVPLFLSEQVVEHVGVSYGYIDGEDVCYNESPPAFENICGGITLANSDHISEIVSLMESAGGAGGCNILKRSRTAFGVCFELFTVYGNITLRKDKHFGGTVSFKGARDVRKIFIALQEALGRSFVARCALYRSGGGGGGQAGTEPRAEGRGEPTCTPPQPAGARQTRHRHPKVLRPRAVIVTSASGRRRVARVAVRVPPPSRAAQPPRLEQYSPSPALDALYAGFFGVHMAVVTACLGKRLSVSPGNSLEVHLVRVLGPGAVSIVTSLDDDNNSVKIRVTDWSRVAAVSSCAQSPVGRDALGGGVIQGSENTISITGRGSVIVRLSWDSALPWGDGVECDILSSCAHLCNVLRGCC